MRSANNTISANNMIGAGLCEAGSSMRSKTDTNRPQISFVLATHNRRDVVIATLLRLTQIAAETDKAEIIVVNNASTDGTAEAIRQLFSNVQLITLKKNLGSCAKAFGVDQAQSEYVVFLDDDSCPQPGSIAKMITHFESDDQLGAAGFIVHLPDAGCECSALPNVFVGCGTGFRRKTLSAVGGLDPALFMQAEEYDLSFRIINAGWKIKTFPDLHVDHLKTPHARVNKRTVYFDTRNNLIVAARYLPDEYEAIYRQDWQQRYRWIATDARHLLAYWRARFDAWRRRQPDRQTYAHHRLSEAAFETLFSFTYIDRQMRALAEQGIRKMVLADLGKNIYPFLRSTQQAELHITCIADDRFARAGRHYRGISIRTVAEALKQKPEAIVISNTSPVHAALSANRLAALASNVPVFRWFGYDIA